MTPEESYERSVLKTATPEGKFAVQMGYALPGGEQKALERLQMRDWVRLIDVSPVKEVPTMMFRIFMAMPVAMAWLESVKDQEF